MNFSMGGATFKNQIKFKIKYAQPALRYIKTIYGCEKVTPCPIDPLLVFNFKL